MKKKFKDYIDILKRIISKFATLNKKYLLGLVLIILIVASYIFYFRNNTSIDNTPKLFWKQVNTGLTTLTVNTIVEDINNPSILYAGTDTGIFKSINKGENWVSMNSNLLSPLPSIKRIIYALNSKAVFALSGGGDLFETLDGGNNWILRGVGVENVALKPSSNESFGEKIYIQLYGFTATDKNPVIYSISTGIGFFSEPQQETRTEINSFYEYLYKDQNKINKSNREETGKILGKTIKDDDTSYDVVRVTKIDFLKEIKIAGLSGSSPIKENITSIETQNSLFTWLLTDRTIYFCWEDFQNCEEEEVLRELLDKDKIYLGNNTGETQYSQSGVPHIYINLGDKLLINTCLRRLGSWTINDSLSKLGLWPIPLFVYSHSNQSFSSMCDEKAQNGIRYLEDVIFALNLNKNQTISLLVSKDNAKTWKVFATNLSRGVNSLFVSYDETANDYTVYIATKDRGILKTVILSKNLK